MGSCKSESKDLADAKKYQKAEITNRLPPFLARQAEKIDPVKKTIDKGLDRLVQQQNQMVDGKEAYRSNEKKHWVCRTSLHWFTDESIKGTSHRGKIS